MKNVIKLICVGAILFGLSACGEKDSKDVAQTSSAESSSKSSSTEYSSVKKEVRKVPVVVLEQELGVSTSADLGKIGCKISQGEPYKNAEIPNPPKEWVKYSFWKRYKLKCQKLEDIGFERAEFVYDNNRLARMMVAEYNDALVRVQVDGLQPSFERFEKLSNILGEKYNEVRRGERYVVYNNGDGVDIYLTMNKAGLLFVTYELKSFGERELALINEFKQQKENQLKGGL
nr:hypothetical protein [uncultured Helicobacter sp.]